MAAGFCWQYSTVLMSYVHLRDGDMAFHLQLNRGFCDMSFKDSAAVEEMYCEIL